MMAALSSVLGEVKGRRCPQWKFPCSVCCKPVKCNQKGLFCDLCNRWCHSRCSDVSDIQYVRLSLSPRGTVKPVPSNSYHSPIVAL